LIKKGEPTGEALNNAEPQQGGKQKALANKNDKRNKKDEKRGKPCKKRSKNKQTC